MFGLLLSECECYQFFLKTYCFENCSFTDGCRQLTFTPEISGRALRRHVIRTLEAASCEWCQIQCFLERRCVSYNCGNNTCDLNSSDHVAHPADLVVDQCKTYQATEVCWKIYGLMVRINAESCIISFTSVFSRNYYETYISSLVQSVWLLSDLRRWFQLQQQPLIYNLPTILGLLN